jgi:multiple sugar transport system permease protein
MTTPGAVTVRPAQRRRSPRPPAGGRGLWLRTVSRGRRWLFLLPAIVYVLALFVYPIAYNVLLSVRQSSVIGLLQNTASFVGLTNYRVALTNPALPGVIAHTAIFMAASLVLQFGVGFLMALFFTQRFPLSGLLRSLILVPWLLPGVVTGLILRLMFDPNSGMINQVLSDVGLIHRPIEWLTDTHLALLVVVLANIWIGIPFNMLLLHGGLQDIPKELYEAARVDGAGRLRTFRSVTVPVMRPVIAVVLVLGFIYTLKAFDIVIILTGGGPINATQLLSTWTYTLSFTNLDFGQGAAVGTLMMLISLVCALGYVRSYRGEMRR